MKKKCIWLVLLCLLGSGPLLAVDNDGDGYHGDVDDCDDSNANVNPGATEICDGVDNDCDGLVDSNDDSLSGGTTYYPDIDGDTYGDPANPTMACEPLAGHVTDNTDCNDAEFNVNPGADEVCDGMDNDCDGWVDDDDDHVEDAIAWCSDADGDGFGDDQDQTLACTQPAGHVADCTDCDDADLLSGGGCLFEDRYESP